MDKLTTLAIDYQTTNNQKAVLEIQRMIVPLIKKLMNKWHFDNFPEQIRQEIIDESLQLILSRCLVSYDTTRGDCKFTSYFMTSENFFLRSQYMKYFQKGKSITKREGEFKCVSLNDVYQSSTSEIDREKELPDPRCDIRNEAQINILLESIEKLSGIDRRMIDRYYIENESIEKISSSMRVPRKEVKDRITCALEKIGTNIR